MSSYRLDPRDRRGARIGGALLALLGLGVAVVAIVALRHPNGRQAKAVSLRTVTVTPSAGRTHTGTASPSHAATNPPSGTPSSTHPIPLIVLNSTTISGLEDSAKQQFEQGGWTVTSTNTIVNDILSTCAYYDPSNPANEQAAMQLQRQFPTVIKRVKEKFPELPPGPIVVVLTSDYSP